MTTHIYSKEMGASHGEFFRLLSAALGSSDYVVKGPEISFSPGQDKAVKITLGPEGTRRIALFAIPITSVSVILTGYSVDEAASFMKLFDRAYQRGGG